MNKSFLVNEDEVTFVNNQYVMVGQSMCKILSSIAKTRQLKVREIKKYMYDFENNKNKGD